VTVIAEADKEAVAAEHQVEVGSVVGAVREDEVVDQGEAGEVEEGGGADPQAGNESHDWGEWFSSADGGRAWSAPHRTRIKRLGEAYETYGQQEGRRMWKEDERTKQTVYDDFSPLPLVIVPSSLSIVMQTVEASNAVVRQWPDY